MACSSSVGVLHAEWQLLLQLLTISMPCSLCSCPCVWATHCPYIYSMQEGVVSSGNSLDYSKEDWDQLASIGAAVKEMEAAGISWVAHLHNVPFLALKAITDIVDGDRPVQEEFLKNLHAAAKALQVRVLAYYAAHETFHKGDLMFGRSDRAPRSAAGLRACLCCSLHAISIVHHVQTWQT